ncbi:N-acetylglucosaminyl-diphospho-decaprenol L-rhamnosyltransferase [Thermoflexales bacterium]|nr:N-acetylglucosaminyl-diphospho-decaprenol L-rhamnosyltransferase [Thermoflexales bacterium]
MMWQPVTVVILNWNLYEDTVACVESVQAAWVEGLRILVVDNGSDDGSPDRLAARFGDQIALVRNARNAGFAAGNNAGIEYALQSDAQSVLILNNDTIVETAMLQMLLQAVEAAPTYHLVGPAIFYESEPQRLWRIGDRYTGRWRLPRAVRAQELDRTVIPVDFLTGCAVLVQRQVFETIGLFDPRYLFYFEDADFCERARRAGFQLACVPAARMWHKVSRSADKVSVRSRYNQARGRVQFYRTLPPRSSVALIACYLAWKTLITVGRDATRWRGDLVRAGLRGAYDGWRA